MQETRDSSSIPGLGRSPGGGHGNPLQYSCLEKPMDRGTWWATQSDTTEATKHRRDMLGEEELGEDSQITRLEMTDSLIL